MNPQDQDILQTENRPAQAAWLAIIYAAIAGLMLLITELLLPWLAEKFGFYHPWLESAGHLFFVGLTACLLYFLQLRPNTGLSLFFKQKQNILLKQFYELPFVGMAILSPETQQWILVNDRLCQILGYSKEELQKRTWLEIIPAEDRAKNLQQYEEMIRGERESFEMDTRFTHKDGSLVFAHVDIRCQHNERGTKKLAFATFEDITVRQRQEQELKTTTRLYQVMSSISQAIVRHGNQPELFNAACEIAVRDGGFCMAWIGVLQPDGQIIPVAHAGNAGDYLENLHISLSDTDSTGPTATALREGRYMICTDIATDPRMAPWRERALALGFSASAAFPLRVNGATHGTFNLYASNASFFNKPELALLEEMADDIAFAISLLEAEKTNKAIYASLQESQAKLMMATEAANIGLWDINLETRDAWVSDTYYTMLGYEAKNTATMDWWYSIMHPEDRDSCRTSMQLQIASNQQRIGVQYRAKHQDGSWRWLAGTGQVASRNANGEATRLIGINLDLTAHLEAEVLREREAERVAGLLELATAEAGMSEKELLQYGLNLAEKLTDSKIAFLHFINSDQQSIELVAWSTATLTHCEAVFDTHYPISRAGIWADCVAQRQAVICNDYATSPLKRGLPEGHFPLIRFISVPMIENDSIPLIIGVGNREEEYNHHDVETIQFLANDLWRIIRRRRAEAALVDNLHEQLKLNARLEEASKQLLQSEKLAAIGQLAAGVAHELNNPIGFVHSNLGTLEGYVNDLMTITEAWQSLREQVGGNCPQAAAVEALMQAKDYAYICNDLPQLINESKEGLSRVRQIVQDLKDFSRAGETTWEWSDLHKGLDSTLNIVWNELKYKCTVHKEYGDIPAVYCLPSQLNQVFMNLLVNASHAIEKRGDITIRTGTEAGRVWIEISDTGKGIPPEHLSKIFDPFFTTKPVGQGTGLGLSLSYSIMQRHQGSLTVSSEVGKGTTFRIELPVKPDPTQENVVQKENA